MNYYPFHIGDYLSATRHLSWEEDAAYRRLLDTYYTTEKSLPVEKRAVYRLVLAATDSQRAAVDQVLLEFFELTEFGWVNGRADEEILAMQDKQQKQRDKANKRWHKPEQEHGIASAMPRNTNTNAVASKNDADGMPPTPTPTPTPINTKTVDTPIGVSSSVWQDFKKIRVAKKAPITPTAMKRIEKQAQEAGLSLEQTLSACCEYGWATFNNDWYQQRISKNIKTGETDYQRSKRELYERAIGTHRISTIEPILEVLQ